MRICICILWIYFAQSSPFCFLCGLSMPTSKKFASLEATLVQNSAHSLTYSLTGVKCRATSVAKKIDISARREKECEYGFPDEGTLL